MTLRIHKTKVSKVKNVYGEERDSSSSAFTAKSVRAVLVFALFTFLFHFAREILQVPLYAHMSTLSHWQAILICLKATLGDIGIALAAFGVGAWRGSGQTWFVQPAASTVAAYLATGVLITIVFEWYAVLWAGRWAYSELMPVVPLFGVGLAPIAQWIVLPPLVLHFLRRHDRS